MSRSQLFIEAALHSGYIVLGADDYGDRRRPLFAGTLPEALEFTRAQFADVKCEAAASAGVMGGAPKAA